MTKQQKIEALEAQLAALKAKQPKKAKQAKKQPEKQENQEQSFLSILQSVGIEVEPTKPVKPVQPVQQQAKQSTKRQQAQQKFRDTFSGKGGQPMPTVGNDPAATFEKRLDRLRELFGTIKANGNSVHLLDELRSNGLVAVAHSIKVDGALKCVKDEQRISTGDVHLMDVSDVKAAVSGGKDVTAGFTILSIRGDRQFAEGVAKAAGYGGFSDFKDALYLSGLKLGRGSKYSQSDSSDWAPLAPSGWVYSCDHHGYPTGGRRTGKLSQAVAHVTAADDE